MLYYDGFGQNPSLSNLSTVFTSLTDTRENQEEAVIPSSKLITDIQKYPCPHIHPTNLQAFLQDLINYFVFCELCSLIIFRHFEWLWYRTSCKYHILDTFSGITAEPCISHIGDFACIFDKRGNDTICSTSWYCV